ncbi:hypothetical protein QDX25_00585 [Auritidibacter ignavus]|uniref:Protein-glutamine gamma-glutamyltransferase-like C-terminal domain-containing protein n=2 Tax=Auritidibacter ignavus TaxID=678932 RepID=A0AAJ6DC54_9MICC|nr:MULTISPECIES: hypothetical protein [Auritidibacter]WGH81714.1 hypothetical protein QDX25_00585 [Auritidibacter ignavus]WGH86327.1 hypothetical protein QDX24_00410 [Auritidibacter ignavus]WGH88611.1 hypothetical protein QDX22_00410 [Auritidibacter ignavus]WGH90926.1 hypothetical protein QDX23_00580 [Auritidibacter ignavus]WGH93300.1 hypothetical protein QDX21_00315 [Auritidibacter ignavus]
MVMMSPPLTPDAEQARQWTEEELSKPEYAEADPGPIIELIDNLVEWFQDLATVEFSGSGELGVIVLALALVALLIALVLWLRPGRTGRVKTTSTDEVEVAADVTATEYLDRARRHVAEQDYAHALADALRSMIRDGQQRDLVSERPSLTATFATTELAEAFPPFTEQLEQAAVRFNATFYAHQSPSATDATQMIELAEKLHQAKPAPATPRDDSVPAQHAKDLVPR